MARCLRLAGAAETQCYNREELIQECETGNFSSMCREKFPLSAQRSGEEVERGGGAERSFFRRPPIGRDASPASANSQAKASGRPITSRVISSRNGNPVPMGDKEGWWYPDGSRPWQRSPLNSSPSCPGNSPDPNARRLTSVPRSFQWREDLPVQIGNRADVRYPAQHLDSGTAQDCGFQK